MDLIRLFCAGSGDRFGEAVCEYYIRSAAECNLLKQSRVGEIFEKGRCKPSNFLKSAVKRSLIKYKDLIQTQDLSQLLEYIPSITFMLSNRLKDIRIKKGHNLAVLLGYINKAAYTEVISILQSEGLLDKWTCGSCIFLSELKPYICRRENIDVIHNGVTQLKDNPFYLKERKKTDKCKEGFKAHTFIPLQKDSDDNSDDNYNGPTLEKLEHYGTLEKSDSKIEIEKINEILKKRAINAKHLNTKKIYQRQYNVFINLYHYISEDYSLRKAKQLIATKIGKTVKTIERDIDDIKDFLNKELYYA